MFPRLNAVQIARLSVHGRKISTQQGQILAEPGDRLPMFVVLSGSVEILQPTLTGFREFLPSATSGPAASSGSRPRWVKDRRAFSRCIACCMNECRR
jgi:hypothetical protein